MPSPDFLLAGAGIVGLSLALELRRRGHSVTLLEAGRPVTRTSIAAAGMLAVDDPGNPPSLHPLSALSATLYPAYLDHIADLAGTRVPFQTTATLEAVPPGVQALDDPQELLPRLASGPHRFALLDERSVDPRQLAPALHTAAIAAGVEILEDSPLERLRATPSGVAVDLPGQTLHSSHLVDCMGTWSPVPHVTPRKGQMLAVRLPSTLDLALVLRTPDVYLVPRTAGPDAGRLVIGATVEDAGFNTEVHALDILTLHARATRLLPQLAEAEFLESWAGLRPSTPDGLPMLGATRRQPRYVLATGHFRNGILLAPATARVVAQMLLGETPAIDLAPFSPERF